MKNLITIFIFLFTATAMAQDPADEIRSLMNERDDKIKELLGPEGSTYTDQQRDELKAIINGIIDFKAMSKTALEETYDTVGADLRNEFIELFTTIVRDHSLNKLDIYRAKVSYKDISVSEGTARVNTIAELDDVRTPVDYKLNKVSDGEWVITDMSVDDVWTAESYNRQFQRIIRKRGFDALMKSLRKRAAKA